MRFTIPGHLQVLLQQQQFNHYVLKVPPGVSLETVVDSATFVHCRKAVRLYDLWTVIAQDGTYEADFRIVGINTVSGEMNFRLLREWFAPGEGGRIPDPAQDVGKAVPIVEIKGSRYKARWNAGHKQFEVVIVATGEVAAQPFVTMDAAKEEAARLETSSATQKAA